MGAAEVVFEKQGHFWMDSGLVGLIKTLESMKPENITYEVRENRLILKGNEKDVQLAKVLEPEELIENVQRRWKRSRNCMSRGCNPCYRGIIITT